MCADSTPPKKRPRLEKEPCSTNLNYPTSSAGGWQPTTLDEMRQEITELKEIVSRCLELLEEPFEDEDRQQW